MSGPGIDDIGNKSNGAAAIESSNGRLRGIWSRQTLRRRHEQNALISNVDGTNPFSEKRLDPAGYRLRMGPQVYVSPAKDDAKESVRKLEPDEAFFIPPGQFAFLLTEEVVHVPPDALAFIALRSKEVKFKGLVNVSGFHADPGYNGRLIFAVYNAGPGDVHLHRGQELFMIMLADLDQVSERPRDPDDGFTNIPTSLIGPLAGKFQSFAGLKENIDEIEEELDDRLRAMEREVAVLRWAVVLFLGALVALAMRAYLGP